LQVVVGQAVLPNIIQKFFFHISLFVTKPSKLSKPFGKLGAARNRVAAGKLPVGELPPNLKISFVGFAGFVIT
jgi:hypothetical protein